MEQPIVAWHKPPTAAELRQHRAPHLLVCLPENRLPDWSDDAIFQAALSCVQFAGVNVLENVLPNQTLWLLPEPHCRHLHDFFGEREIIWQTPTLPPQNPILPEKLWFRQPEIAKPSRVIVVGAGIAGAATAYELAKRGVSVQVLDAAPRVANAASGNRQGLLYAKISPHDTPQTELLLSAYGYARNLLAQMLPEREFWGETGVLHLNHDPAEAKRNALLAQQTWHNHLYRGVSAAQASELAEIDVGQGGLFWQHGCWLNPAAWVAQLLSQPNIDLHLNNPVLSAQHDGENWQIHTPHATFSGSHIVFCTGAHSRQMPIIGEFPLQIIRGQTSVVAASPFSGSLKTAISGASYIAPAWGGWHTFGATFQPNDPDETWRDTDEIANQHELAQLNPQLHHSFQFSGSLKGHAALRCDAHDHLPVAGALGEPAAMRVAYAKLALDKNYRLTAPCPHYPNAFANTAHGSRGLTTAPFCAAQIAAQICGEPQPFSQRLREALHPNRLIIRQIVRHTKL